MIRFVRWHARRSVAVGLVAAGLGAGGLWLAQGHGPITARAQEAPPPVGQGPETAPVKVSAKPTGVVMAIADDRASFTFRTQAGEERTIRVTERTVVTGGGDRPYTMELLQVGDYVRVKIVGMKDKAPDAAKAAKRAGRKPKPAVTDDASLARRVIVRPAAEGPFAAGGKPEKGARKSGLPGAGKKKGGSADGASQ